ncbi:unnamed protein product [Prorocentrum cordatum]|uniref:Integrase catalytic domain-containing protein n=1 Tax=Prorocentrum cordatum TaxID=2364126 RepID=A0ABN9TFN3_9DINO|nr:unnamed protein product [Polarella glacialis]
MTKNNGTDDIIPKWNGDLTTVDDYERDVEAYIRGTRRDERYVCGPRLWRRLEGRARQAAKDVDWDRMEKDDGAAELLRHVRAMLGAQPIQDAVKYLARWIFDLRRDTGDPMPSYISRDDEAYHDVVKGFDTEYFKKQRTARLSERSNLWNTHYSELKWFLYKIEHEGPEDAAEVAKDLNWRLWSFVSNGLEEIPEHPDFGTDFNQEIPLDQLRGWLLLQRSRLSPTERAAVISAVKGNFDYDSIGKQLRVSWPDDELTNRDKKQGKEPLYSAQEIEDAETAFAAQQRSFEVAEDSASFKGPGLDPEALDRRVKDGAEGADSDVTDHLDEMEIAPKDAEMEANLITNETTRIELETAMLYKPVSKNKPKREKRQLDKTQYLQVEKSIEMRERVQHVKLPSWPTLEKLDDWILMSVKQSSSKGFGILDIGATSSIMGIEAAENLRDIIYEQAGQNIKMDVSQKSTFIFGDGNSKTCTGKATFPLKIAGVDGELEINILDADAPLFIGVDVLSRLGTVIDCEEHSVYFKKLGLKHLISTYEYGDIIITYAYRDTIILYVYRDITITYASGSSDFGNQIAFHIRMSLNRETKCRKAESQQVKLENEEMDGPWEQVDVRVPLEDSGASATCRSPTSTRPTLQRILPQGRLIAHQDTKGNIFYTVEGSELDHSKKRMTDIVLLEHLPNWEMWSSKLLRQWTQCRRWGRVIQKVFLKTIDHVNWKLDSLGLPVQLLPEKYPTWPTDLENRAKIEQCPPSTKVSAFAALSSEQIYEQLSMVTLGNHLRPLCKMWGLTQSGKKEEVVDKIIAYIIEQRGSSAATIKIKMETETKKTEKAPMTVCPALPAHYTQMCQHPDCKLCRGIAKNEPIVKVKPYGWCHQAIRAATHMTRSAIFGATCALTTFGRLTMVEACTHEDSNLGKVCDEKGYHYERLGLFNENDLSKPQGYHKAKFLLDEKRPELFVSTPPCGPWSIMQNVNQRDDRQRENLRRKRLKSQRIFENNKRLIEHQVLNLDGSALAEQPHNSRSWQKTCWKDLHKILPYEVIVDGCACGLRAPDTGELMKKRWKFLTNDKRIWVALQPLQCRGGYYHEEIESSLRTEASGYYPKMLRRRILRALTKSQNQNYFEDEVVKCLCMAATQQPPTEPTPVEVLRLAKTFKCDICDAHRPPTKRPPASSAEQPQNGHEVLFDAFSWIRRSKKTNVMALAILDAGSDILYVRLIDEKEIPGTTRQVRAGDLRHIFATKWFPWMGRPKVMRYDPAGSAISNEFREWIESQGVYCLPCAADAHWQIGKIERAIEAFKEALDAFDEMVSAEVPTSEMIGLQTAARNDLIRIDGFSPLQRYAGRTPTGTTVNLSDEPNNLPLISAELQDGTFSRDAQVRRLARLAHIQTENSDRVKRAEAARFRSFKRYETGDLVCVYRRIPPGAWIKKGQPRSMPGRGRWYGPGRVLCHEPSSSGHRPGLPGTVVNITLAGRLYRVAPEQLRPATPSEEAMDCLRSRREQPGTWTFGDVQKLLDQNEVIDLSNESPPTGEDLAADDGESVSARTFEGNASGPWAIPEDWKSDLFPDRDLHEGEIVMEAPPDDDQAERPSQQPIAVDTDDDLDETTAPDVNDKRRLRSPGSTEPPAKKQRINVATQEAFSYYLQEGNFYGDYAYSVQQYDETKEDDELIVLDIPVSNEHAFMAYMDDPSNFVASQARKGRLEVSFKKATPEEKKLLLEAQQKECTSVLSTKAVRILSRKGIDPARLLRCRFVLTWKKDEQGNVLRGKARLVVLGFSDPDLLHLRTESPVASRRARQLLLAMAARHKWKLEKADAVTAFLQGETDEEKRKIYADPPKDARQAFGMKDDDVLQFLKPMYGFVHAPRKWWLHFKDTLRTLKLEIVQCEPCVWVIRDGNKMVGMVILHVDDMMIAGDHNNSAFLKKRQEIQQAFEWTPWESRAFVKCAISIRQNEDYTCSLAQDSYSLNVEPIKIRRGRKPTEGVSDKERSDLRGRLGTVGWRAQQSAPWLSAKVSLLQAEIPTATVSTIQKINKLIRTMNDTADVVMLIPAIEQIAVVGWGDAAWAARITGESQGGEIVVLAPLSFLSGSTETVAPISWRSCKLPRVARSSTSAEVQMMTEPLDEISYVRLFIYELECGQVDYTNKQHVNDAISSCPGVLVTDGKSGYDAIEKSESAGLGLRDKRTSIECLGIRQQKEQTALQIRWVHSDAMLADGLTKDRAAKVLLEFFRSGQRWRLVDDPLHRSARKRKTEGMDKLDHGKPISDDCENAMLEALTYYARDNPDEQESPAGDAALWGMMKPLTRSVLSVNSVARGRSRCRNIDL